MAISTRLRRVASRKRAVLPRNRRRFSLNHVAGISESDVRDNGPDKNHVASCRPPKNQRKRELHLCDLRSVSLG